MQQIKVCNLSLFYLFIESRAEKMEIEDEELEKDKEKNKTI